MQKAAGITPIATSIGKGWRNLDPVCTDSDPHILLWVLRQLRKPRTFALFEGTKATGFLWWNQGWVWERWHWGRWPVQLLQGRLEEIAALAGADASGVTDSFEDDPDETKHV